MQHRHLLPNEIDLLLDGEVGFGVAPLRAHIEDCAECQARLTNARLVVDALEDLPHFAPRLRFEDRVMARVQVIEPWYAVVADAARRLAPQSAPVRLLTAATATVAATAMTTGAFWLALHSDVAAYAIGLAVERTRSALLIGAGTVIGDTLGQPGLDAIRSGSVGTLVMAAGLALLAVGGATFGLRAFATASRRIRE